MFTFYLLYGIKNNNAYLVDDAVRLVTFTK